MQLGFDRKPIGKQVGTVVSLEPFPFPDSRDHLSEPPGPFSFPDSTFSTFYFLWSKFQTFCNGVTPGTLGVDIIESQDWGPLGGLSREYEPPSPVYRCASRPARSRHCTAPSYLTLPRHPGAGTVSGKVVAIDPLPAVLQSSHTPPRCIVTSTRGGNTWKKTVFPPIFRTFLGYLESRRDNLGTMSITRLLFILPC